MPKAPSNLLPTDKSAAEIREAYSRAIRQRSVFSARCTQAGFLEKLRGTMDKLLSGDISEAYARQELQFKLYELGYDSERGGFPGDSTVPPAERDSLRDLASDMRLKLILAMQQSIANNLARKAEAAADPYEMRMYPAWRFVRVGKTDHPRDWSERWEVAGFSVGWEGAVQSPMVALKTSPIWAALGEGVGGYGDSTGSDVPPFAYNSLMSWEDVEREEAMVLGLIDEDADIEIDFNGELSTEEISVVLDSIPKDIASLLEVELW